MARYVKESEKEDMLALLADNVKQYPPQFPNSVLPLKIVLNGELREKWSADEIETTVRTLGMNGPFNRDQVNTL